MPQPAQPVRPAAASAAVAKAPQVGVPSAPVSIGNLMRSDEVQARFRQILGRDPGNFIAAVLSVANSPAMLGCDPNTIMSAAATSAALGLTVDPNLGYAHIIPFNDKVRGKIAQFQMGWRGFFQLAMNSQAYLKITVNEVYEGELEVKNRFTEEFEIHPRKSDKVVGYIAYYKMINGAEKYLYMTREEVDAHAKRYSQSYKFDTYGSSVWSKNFDAMAKKTVLKLLLSKYGKLSIKMEMAHRFDQAVVNPDAISGNIEEIQESDVTYIDNPQHQEPLQPTASQIMTDAGDQFAKADKETNKDSKNVQKELF